MSFRPRVVECVCSYYHHSVFNFFGNFSSIPPKYANNSSVHQDSSGEVVILMPAIDVVPTDSLLIGELPEQSVCIDTEPYIEPNSPKTTESSSKCCFPIIKCQFFFLLYLFWFYDERLILIHLPIDIWRIENIFFFL